MSWVREDRRETGVGARLVAAFESEAVARGCTHVFVTSFTFQAPGFYQRLGYEEIFRWGSVPTPGRDDVHTRKELSTRRVPFLPGTGSNNAESAVTATWTPPVRG